MADMHVDYGGYNISWQEPPLFPANWQANVASDDHMLYRQMCQRTGRQGAEVIAGRTRDEMLINAKAFIDRMLDGAAVADRAG